MTKKERLEKAIKDYPPGTIIKTAHLSTRKEKDKTSYTILSDDILKYPTNQHTIIISDNQGNRKIDSEGYSIVIYYNKIWAKKLNNVELENIRKIIYDDR